MMKKNIINANSFADLLKSAKSTSYAPLSKSCLLYTSDAADDIL